MFYEIARFPDVSKFSLIAANIDRVCDIIPGVSFITNITRLALKILSRFALVSISTVIFPVFVIKGLIDTILRRHKFPFFHNFDLFLRTVFKTQSLFMGNFFIWRYFEKSILKTLRDTVPFVGLACQMYNKQETSAEFVKNQLISEIDSMHNTKAWLIPSEAYPYYLPEGFKQNKDVYLANFKLNPTRFQEIPEEFFGDQEFVVNMLDGMCLEIAYKHLNFSFEEAKALFSGVIDKAHFKGILLDITLPVETLYLNPKFMDLCASYPFLLWMFSNIEFLQNKKFITPIVNHRPHLVTRLNPHFLKLHPAIFHKAISLNPKLSQTYDDSLLVFAFTVKPGIQNDPLFKEVGLIKPGFCRYVMDLLARKQIVAQLRL